MKTYKVLFHLATFALGASLTYAVLDLYLQSIVTLIIGGIATALGFFFKRYQ